MAFCFMPRAHYCVRFVTLCDWVNRARREKKEERRKIGHEDSIFQFAAIALATKRRSHAWRRLFLREKLTDDWHRWAFPGQWMDFFRFWSNSSSEDLENLAACWTTSVDRCWWATETVVVAWGVDSVVWRMYWNSWSRILTANFRQGQNSA